MVRQPAGLHYYVSGNPLSQHRPDNNGGRDSDQQRVKNRFADVRFKDTDGCHRAWMRGHETMRAGKSSQQWYAQMQQRQSGFTHNREQDRRQQHQADAEEHRNADDESYDHHGPMQPTFAQCADEHAGDDFRPARFGEHFPQHCAQADDHGDVAQHLADALLKCRGDLQKLHPGAQPDEQ